MKKSLFLLLTSALLAACSGDNSTTTVSISSDSTLLTVESALSTINGALNDAEQINSYAMRVKKDKVFSLLSPKFSLISQAEADPCSLTRFSPPVGSASCVGTINDRTIFSQFNSCTAGQQDEFVFRGTMTLTFDSAPSCNSWVSGLNIPTSGNMVRTTVDFERFNPGGSSVKTSSAPHVNYLNSTIAGGVKTSFSANTRTVEILGLHRNGVRADGSAGFDHSVYTTQPLVVTGTKAAGTREVTSGALRVDHNTLKYSVVASVSGLKWGASCCHPVEGTINWELSGANSGTIAVQFSTGTCGSVQVNYSNGGSEKFTLLSCE